jgi:hypothetical protein
MPDSKKPVVVELGIEFVVELLLFLYPYGADQMNLPHNFWLGLGCWIVGTAIAIRMFWIFPAWSSRLTRLEKGLLSLIATAALVAVFYGPVVAAYGKRNRDSETKLTTQQPIESDPHKTADLPVDTPVKPIPASARRKVPSRIEANPISTPKVADHLGVGVSGDKIPVIGGITQGAGSALSINQQGGITAGTVNLGPPPLPTPTIKVCLTHPPTPEGQLHSTVITLTTDVQITRPWFFSFLTCPSRVAASV